MPDPLPVIIDPQGNTRLLGTIPKVTLKVTATPVFEDTFSLYTDAEIRDIITDPNRTPKRKLFTKEWILNQKSHGSCNGHAIASCLARMRWLSGILDKLLFSGAYAYSKMNGGGDNGSALEDDIPEVTKWGIAPASLVTWDMIYPRLQPPNADTEAAKHKGFKPFAVRTMQGLRTALAKNFACVVAMQVGNSFSNLDSNGICGFDHGMGNHALCCDDLVWNSSLNKELFDIPNSWGPDFGDDGRLYATERHFSETFNNHMFVALPGINEAS